MVQINEDEKAAKVIVPDYQLSLAIGKEGQNARLAAKLTGWKIDIKSQSQTEQEVFGEEFANADTSFDSLAETFGMVGRLNEEAAEEEAEQDILEAAEQEKDDAAKTDE